MRCLSLFLSGGELFDFIEENGPMNETQARQMFLQMIAALIKLAELGTVVVLPGDAQNLT